MFVNELHVKVSAPKRASSEYKNKLREHARRMLAERLLDFLDEQKAKITLEIKEQVITGETAFNELSDDYEIWVDVIGVDVKRINYALPEKTITYDQTTKTIFGKIDDYLRKVARARKYHWGM